MTTNQHLELDGHRLVPAQVKDGSVLKWECENCGHHAEDAYDYVSIQCPPA